MTMAAIDVLSWICLVTGGFFGIVGGIGLLRLPDLFSRFHAAGVTDTLGAGLILIGLMLQAGWSLITIKLVLILGFGLFTSPTATHALAKAALHGKVKPRLSRKGT
ncbi:MAG: monovalent cation/H(+) antiporter subunit G [Gammaproteobacteria bacterium]|jgi:multicomponent Na+:H+ antiporter subunit G|nr:monovalent cation/H(+) antiporter subunit G [Gammaproteobacteria bacterium]